MITHSYSEVTDWFMRSLQALLQKQETVTIALPGWHSLDGWYASILWNPDVWKGIDKTCLRWCLVDERCVPAESPDRNDAYVWKTFLEPLGFLSEQFLGLWMPEVDALEYSKIIGIPDVAIFGLWPDGHIASLFPGHPLLFVQTEGYVHMFDAPKMPPERITLTVPSIQKIPHTALFAVWIEKQEALKNSLKPEKTLIECPSKILNPDIIFQW